MKPIELEDTFAGCDITSVCWEATALATKGSVPVHFNFNGTDVLAQPGEEAETVASRWRTDYDAASEVWRNDPQRKVEAAEAEAKELRERTMVMVDTSVGETAMRDAEVPWPKTEEQLASYISSLVHRDHDYGTCVYAMSMAAVAAFHYVAGKMGATGFQSGCADMDILRRTRSMKGPFMLLNGEHALYPQYDLIGKVEKALEEWKPWLKEEATKKLADPTHAHPDVIAHWKALAEK